MLSFSAWPAIVLFRLIVISNGQDLNETVPQLRFATPCATPNLEEALCIEIQRCQILSTATNLDFVEKSKCGPKNENPKTPRVCCGNYADYANVTTTTSVPEEQFETKPHLPKKCGRQNVVTANRIVGGAEAALGEFPWMVRLRHRNSNGQQYYGCSGFLISRKYVMTAAHCIDFEEKEQIGPIHEVQLGEHNTESELDCVQEIDQIVCADAPVLIRVRKPIVHPGYSDDSTNHRDDIALLPLMEPVNFTDYIQPICLLETSSEQIELWVSGWGQTENKQSSKIKMKVAVPRANIRNCADTYRTVGVDVLATQFCAGGLNGMDSCTGDSGGPIMVQLEKGIWYAEGIVSFGMGCGSDGWPGVYTHIPKYIDWIQTEIKERNSKNLRSRMLKRGKPTPSK